MKEDKRAQKTSQVGRVSRRAVLTGAAGAVGASVLGLKTPTASGQDRGAAVSPGLLASEVGTRSSFEQPKRALTGLVSRTPLQDLHGTITPADLHFERHHSGVPTIDPRTYRLLVHGLVERPTVFTLNDLKRFPAISRICFLECSGNLGRQGGEKTRPQELCGLTSQSEWTGVMLSTLFREVGVRPDAKWFLAEGQDAAVMTRSIPIEKALDDAMIAYAQNGELLRPEQGYPARLLLPGFEGNSSVKWLRRLDLAAQPFMTREETSKYTDPLADGTARQFSFVMDARSVITSPSYPQTVEPGWMEIRGVAWSGRGKIQRVEISTDGGKTWSRAVLQGPVLPKAHTRFGLMWKWDGAPAVIMSKAVDETGYAQPDWAALQGVRGRRTRYHQNPITGWKVGADGQVLFAIERLS
ncbi:MAG TPA: sulfite dehydrogenase [Terriglobia bacterium]|nr:sulfite dehydrogenase [Terriglobia bacterium]